MNRNDDSIFSRRLIGLANELLSTAYELGARHRPAGNGGDGSGRNHHRDDPMWLVMARQAYRDRRRRNELFDSDLFGEPAWDILLDLFIAAKEAKPISITSACIGAAAPSTTALRWLNILERQGLIEREGDARDLRRSFVRLTADGYAKMIDYFSGGHLAPGEGEFTRHAANGGGSSAMAGLPPAPRRAD